MNADRLLAWYERIADAPDAVGRLRRFVLDLAVRGKLVPQDPADEPASELLKRIAKEKARLVKAGEIKADKPLAPVDDDAVFDLPSNWRWTRLGVIASYVQRGKSPKYAAADGALVVSQKCVQWAGLDLTVAKQVTLESLADYEPVLSSRWRLALEFDGNRNDRTGDPTFDPPEKLVCDSHVTVVRCPEVIPEYVRTWLRSDHVYALIEGRASGSTNQVELTAQMAINQVFPLPPLAEQHRIVAKVDELMALCDRLEAARAEREATRDRLAAASLSRLNAPDPETFTDDARFALNALPALTTRPDQLKQLRQTILNLAVRGKLVPQDPADEPASELLKRIAKERTGPQAVKKARRNGEVDISSLRVDTALADGWRWTNIDEVALSMRYGTSTKCEYDAPGVPVLRIPNVSAGVVSLDDIKFGPLTEGEIRDLALNSGDILMIRSNGSLDIVGRSAVVTSAAAGVAFAGYLVRLRLSLANIMPEFIWLALNSSDVRDQIERPIRSAVGLKNVNLTEFGALTFPLPPLAEQHRIVAKVDDLMALCDQLEASLTTGDATRRRLLDALLAEALAPAATDERQAA